jgi:hypothetical protein
LGYFQRAIPYRGPHPLPAFSYGNIGQSDEHEVPLPVPLNPALEIDFHYDGNRIDSDEGGGMGLGNHRRKE